MSAKVAEKPKAAKADLPPPYTSIEFSYTADKDGMVNFDETLGAPDGSTAVAINIKVTQPANNEARKAKLSVEVSTKPLEAMLFNATQNIDLFNKENIKCSADVAFQYRDGCPCVYPLDGKPCSDGSFQAATPLDPELPGAIFKVTGTLGAYKKGDQVSGFVVLVLDV